MNLNLQSVMSVLITTISYQVGTDPDHPTYSRHLFVYLNLQSVMSVLITTIRHQVENNPDL